VSKMSQGFTYGHGLPGPMGNPRWLNWRRQTLVEHALELKAARSMREHVGLLVPQGEVSKGRFRQFPMTLIRAGPGASARHDRIDHAHRWVPLRPTR
jgi:hypothetical protein